jgi:hypothetical protein
MLRKCPKCGRILPESDFAPHTRICKICRRDYDWQYRYGISPEQYLELYKAQNGKCKICGCELPEGKYLHIDHDKQTGEVRGLLCGKCNAAIGLLKEDKKVMNNAIKYIEDNNQCDKQ